MLDEILKILPLDIVKEIKSMGGNGEITEIRLRVGKKARVITSNIEIKLEYIVTLANLLDILVKVSKNSIYAIQNEINNGFVVIKGGHRIGICGEVILENGKIKNIKNINSMNIRIARQIFGAADKVMPYIVQNNCINNTLIVSPPRLWKNNYFKRYYKTNK